MMRKHELEDGTLWFVLAGKYTGLFRVLIFKLSQEMFADLHHLHHFISLEQGGSVTATSWVAGTNQGEADIYFGKKTRFFLIWIFTIWVLPRCLFFWRTGIEHINADNVAEDWLADDQVSAMNVGVNGPVLRNEVCYSYFLQSLSRTKSRLVFQGMYNNYTAVKTYWSDTTLMDNLRGGDATGLATPGAQEISFTYNDKDEVWEISGNGNTVHTYSADSFY
jgi:hypothetical protein